MDRMSQPRYLYKLVIRKGSWLYGLQNCSLQTGRWKGITNESCVICRLLLSRTWCQGNWFMLCYYCVILALLNRLIPNINTLSSPWVRIKPVTFRYTDVLALSWEIRSHTLFLWILWILRWHSFGSILMLLFCFVFGCFSFDGNLEGVTWTERFGLIL